MRTFSQFITEALPPPSLAKQKYYHGTHSQAAMQAIQHEGIKPPEITYKRSSMLTPVRGKVYLTASLGEALAYAMGGSIAGHGWKDTPKEDRHLGIPDTVYSLPAHGLDIDEEPFGYIFVVSGSELKDVDPDEDSIGSAVWQLLNRDFHAPMGEHLKKALGDAVLPTTRNMVCNNPLSDFPDAWGESDRACVIRLVRIAKQYMTPRQFREVVFGEYAQYAAGGKRIMKYIPDWMKQKLIEMGANVAHSGPVKPTECWRIDRRRDIPLLGHGKNFFDVAEHIK